MGLQVEELWRCVAVTFAGSLNERLPYYQYLCKALVEYNLISLELLASQVTAHPEVFDLPKRIKYLRYAIRGRYWNFTAVKSKALKFIAKEGNTGSGFAPLSDSATSDDIWHFTWWVATEIKSDRLIKLRFNQSILNQLCGVENATHPFPIQLHKLIPLSLIKVLIFSASEIDSLLRGMDPIMRFPTFKHLTKNVGVGGSWLRPVGCDQLAVMIAALDRLSARYTLSQMLTFLVCGRRLIHPNFRITVHDEDFRVIADYQQVRIHFPRHASVDWLVEQLEYAIRLGHRLTDLTGYLSGLKYERFSQWLPRSEPRDHYWW